MDHLRLEDLSDREFLLIVADVAAEDGGWADSLQIADRIGISGEHPRRTVAVRLSWLARWGAVQREHARDESGNLRYHRDGRVMHTQRWQLTGIGHDLAVGELRKGLANALDRAGDDQMLLLARWVGRRHMNSTAAKLTEREWRREALLRRR